MGYYDSKGFYVYQETDAADPGAGFSDLLNQSAKAIPNAVHGLVVDELNSDPTLREAVGELAADAVDEAIDFADANLVRKTDPGAPSSPGVTSEWLEVELGTGDRIIAGTRQDGTRHIARLTTETLTMSGIEETIEKNGSDYLQVSVDPSGNIAEPDAIDRNGRTPGWVLRNYANRQRSALSGVVCFGDSMFADFGSLGTSTPSVMSTLLPVPVIGRGVTSQSVTEIALRQGGLNLLVTVDGGSIPASGTVAATVNVSGTWRSQAWTFSGSLCGVPGTLTKSATHVWSFTRSRTGTATPAPAGSLWVSDQPTGPMVGQILRGGRNSPDLANCARDMRAMVTRARATGSPVLVLPVYNLATETTGTSGYDLIKSINAAYEEIGGSDFIDSRAWLIRHGLAEMGITPTAQDTADIAADVIPESLRHDSTHLNVAGRTAEARFLARIITSKDWFRS
ncbi:MAG: hypothetical protein LBE05_04870 [Microbacterium sp.]|jgi:hypothetical protein|nr:hypothetical protein [Microbacterium sp.]